MTLKKLLPAAAAAGLLFTAAAVHAATVVTIDPQANNGGAGVVDPTEPAFNTTGFIGSLGAVLNIYTDNSFLETGRVAVTDWQLNNANLNTNVASTYNIFADFQLTGTGTWNANQYTANQAGAVLSFSLGADTNMDGVVDIQLGTGALDNSYPAIAFALLFNFLVPPNTNPAAFTSFSATVDFTPAPGTTGTDGFFRAPVPFSIDVFAGNVGGTTNDTTWVQLANGTYVITTVGGSGNFDFVQNQVPEPSALALAGLALVGVAAARRRKERTQA